MEDFDKDHSYEKSQVVLANYQKFYPKSLDPSLTPHVSIAPNHPSVDPFTVDNQILHEMNAKDYCHCIRFVIRQMRTFGRNLYGLPYHKKTYGIYSVILYNKYIAIPHMANIKQAQLMGCSKMTFYRKLHHAEKIFSKVINHNVLNHLYKMAIK